MSKEHIIRRTIVGVLIQARPNKRVSFLGVVCLGKLRGFSMDNGLLRLVSADTLWAV